MSIELDRLNIKERNVQLIRMSGIMLQILEKNGGTMDRQLLMSATAKASKVSIVEMKLVVSFTKAERKIVTGTNPSQVTILSK